MLGHVAMLWAKFGSMLGDLTGSTLPLKSRMGELPQGVQLSELRKSLRFLRGSYGSSCHPVGHIAEKIGFVDHLGMGQNPGT